MIKKKTTTGQSRKKEEREWVGVKLGEKKKDRNKKKKERERERKREGRRDIHAHIYKATDKKTIGKSYTDR